eukprot:CAMPEP_0206273086 /NCGR_PEP_ID=MMETSP0047_2-20121206/34394_1 /ASSEMBLY_ACC=CAM_ASM_000192 /TAXON_ID=195065 /ORGANISM="Chroomonas mesostigmatica_cf, Strain CCMP1168" /LENGTH=50 /DNA_ID=CAMNT_0053702131 /DNA_START=83 /DNA_END=232 /DNA_ORIENTATION=+
MTAQLCSQHDATLSPRPRRLRLGELCTAVAAIGGPAPPCACPSLSPPASG